MSAPPPGRLLVHGEVPPPLDRDLTVIGRSINRRDALEKVTGQAIYSSDMTLPGMLHAKILRCPHAHARIRRIDTSRAAALPGVHAVLSLENTRGWHTYWYMIAQPAFPEEIAYVGQEVALVAAETVDIALHALGLIEVEYEVLPAALTPREAMKPDAPRVPVLDVERPREGNVQQPVYVRARGDVDRGLAEADVVSESHFTLPTQYHVDIQTRCCIADWDGERLTVYEASQGVWNVKRELAKSLGLEEDRVRVVVQNMGGGFGSKAGAQRVVHYAARLAMLAGRPVRLELTRPEEFLEPPAALRRRGDDAPRGPPRRHAHRHRRGDRPRHRLGQPLRGALHDDAPPDLGALPVPERAGAHRSGLYQHWAHRSAARGARSHRHFLHRGRDR